MVDPADTTVKAVEILIGFFDAIVVGFVVLGYFSYAHTTLLRLMKK